MDCTFQLSSHDPDVIKVCLPDAEHAVYIPVAVLGPRRAAAHLLLLLLLAPRLGPAAAPGPVPPLRPPQLLNIHRVHLYSALSRAEPRTSAEKN